MSDKKYEQVRLANGICRNCGFRRSKPNCTICVHCLHQKALTQKDLWAFRKENNLCPKCGKREPVPDRWACHICLKKHRNATRRYRKKKV